MANLSVQMKGFAELQARLEQLATTDATKAGQSAVRSGATVALKSIKSEAPVSDVPEGATHNRHRKDGSAVEEAHHKIANNLKIKKTRTPNQHQVAVTIGVGPAYQASLVEFGSIHNKPDPFMLRGIANAIQEIIDQMGKALNKQLIKRGA
jgi:HK97 gp10 family phage protein